MKLGICILLASSIFTVDTYAAAPEKPKSVIHVVNVRFKADAPKAEVDRAIRMIGEMDYAGLKRVWLRPIKNQMEGFTHIIVMEFESEAALQKYTDSPAQLKWYEVYLKVRDESRTNDITN